MGSRYTLVKRNYVQAFSKALTRRALRENFYKSSINSQSMAYRIFDSAIRSWLSIVIIEILLQKI